jgi:hypothetical protein
LSITRHQRHGYSLNFLKHPQIPLGVAPQNITIGSRVPGMFASSAESKYAERIALHRKISVVLCPFLAASLPSQMFADQLPH